MITMNAHRKTEWFDDDTFWRALKSLKFSKERGGDAAAALVSQALKLVQPAGKDVLDLCCGPGQGLERVRDHEWNRGVSTNLFL